MGARLAAGMSRQQCSFSAQDPPIDFRQSTIRLIEDAFAALTVDAAGYELVPAFAGTDAFDNNPTIVLMTLAPRLGLW